MARHDDATDRMPPTPCDAWVVEHGGAVDGLARRVWSLNVTVVAPAAFVEVES